MKCNEVQELLPVYWDLPAEDERRLQADKHIHGCAACREEFEIWRESTELIRSTLHETNRQEIEEPAPTISGRVMKRIYEDEPWRLPVTERVYNFSYTLRRNLTAAIAFSLALFMFSFLYSLIYTGPADDGFASESITFGIQPVASASSGQGNAIDSGLLTASIRPQEPFMFKDGLIQSYPDYLLVLSLLGLTVTLLIMNWLSRTKA